MCGVCSCEPGWSGTACECYDDPEACVDPVTGKSCNDQGSCECGKCNCVAPYFGNFCSHCPVSAYYWSTMTKIIFFFYKFNSDYFQGSSFCRLANRNVRSSVIVCCARLIQISVRTAQHSTAVTSLPSTVSRSTKVLSSEVPTTVI